MVHDPVNEQYDSTRLRRWILFYTIGSAVVLVLLSAALLVIPVYNELRQAQQDRLSQVALTRATSTWQFFVYERGLVQHVSARTHARQLLVDYLAGEIDEADFRERTREMLNDSLRVSDSIAGIQRLDLHDNMLASAGRAVPERLRPDPLEPGESVGRGIPVELDRRHYIVFRSAIVDAHGNAIGSDLFLVYLHDLETLLHERTGLGESGELLIALPNENGLLIFHMPPGGERPVLEPAPAGMHAYVERVRNGATGMVETSRLTGRPQKLAFQPIADSDWVAIAAMDIDELYLPVQRRIALIVVGVVGLALLGASGMFLIVQPLTRGILVHTDALERKNEQITAALTGEQNERRRYQQARDELAVRVRQQARLAELSQEALGGTQLDELMHHVCEQVQTALEVDYVKVLELVSDDALLLRAGVGWKPGLVGQASVDMGRDSQAGYTLACHEPVIVRDLRTESRFTGPPLLREHNVVSGLSVVIDGGDEAFGVLGAHITQRREFSKDDVAFVQAVANVLGQAILRGRTDARLRQLNQTLEQRVAERTRALEQTLEQRDQFFNLSLDILCIAGMDGHFRHINPAVERILGYTPEQIIQRPFMDYIHPEDAPATRKALEELRHSGEVLNFEIRCRHREGGYRWMLWQVAASEDGTIFSVGHDVTERKAAEQRLARTAAALRRSNEELEQFAGIASHDLQEPLRKVETFGKMLEQHAASQLNDQGRDYLARMRDAAQRMQRLISDLLAYARVTTQGRSFRQVDLSRIAREVLSDLEIRIRETDANVELDELPCVEADPLQMRQLLQNLIGNGLKFHKPGEPPHLELWSEPVASGKEGEPEMVRVIVRDHGVGFEQRYAEQVFSPFQRLHSRRDYQGSGMGLPIVHKIVQRHGGSVEAHSEPGMGTTIAVALPLRQAPGADQDEAGHELAA